MPKQKPAFIPCTLKLLPPGEAVAAARTAIAHNPANAPFRHAALASGLSCVADPGHLALLTSKYWGPGGVKLGVAFLDNPSQAVRDKLLAHMNAWAKTAQVEFHEVAQGNAEVRIARTRGQGYWSYLGTDVLHIPAGEPTMMLDSFSGATPDSEYARVVRHETGHTLGFPHEHLRRELVDRLDPQKTVSYFKRTQGWSAQVVREQVLTPLDEALLSATPHADAQSIMCYQLPAGITRDGQPIPGGLDLDQADYDLAARLYPRPGQPAPPPPPPPDGGGTTVTVPRAGTYRLVE